MMNKFLLLTTLLFSSFLLTGCINFNFTVNDSTSVVEDDKPSITTDSWRLFACNEEVGKFFDVKTFWWSWDTEELKWDTYVLSWEVTYKVLSNDVIKHVICTVNNDWSVSIKEM